jgi:hypothetical protein
VATKFASIDRRQQPLCRHPANVFMMRGPLYPIPWLGYLSLRAIPSVGEPSTILNGYVVRDMRNIRINIDRMLASTLPDRPRDR